jgi:hypothetical protein
MTHGRVPICDGAVEKAAVLRHANLRRVIPISPDKYEQVKKENIQLKENNELLLKENSIHRDLLMVINFRLLVCISGGSDSDDDIYYDVDGHFEADSNDLEEDGDDTSDEDHYSDHVSGSPTASREINLSPDGSGTRATN